MVPRLRKFVENALGITLVRKSSPFQLDLYERLYSRARLAEKPFYNVGAGNFWHPYWTNLDFIASWYTEEQRDIVHLDLMALGPLPIEPNSAEILYTSHTIEHVTEEAVRNLFSEALRVLKPGGIFRVITPDAETAFAAMMRGDKDWFYWDEYYSSPALFSEQWSAPPASAPLEERWLNLLAGQLAPLSTSPSPVKYHAAEIRKIVAVKGFIGSQDFFTGQCSFNPERPGNHISWWTHEKVIRYLQDAGFRTVRRSGYGQSSSPLMRRSEQFDHLHPQMSLYIEAIKD